MPRARIVRELAAPARAMRSRLKRHFYRRLTSMILLRSREESRAVHFALSYAVAEALLRRRQLPRL